MPDPSPNGPNGRDGRGRFAQGNAGGPGNPYAGKVAKLRSALLAAVTEDDVREIVERLVRLAKEGDLSAIREPGWRAGSAAPADAAPIRPRRASGDRNG